VKPPSRRRPSARRSPTAGNRNQGSKWLHPPTRRRIYERDGWRCVWCESPVARQSRFISVDDNNRPIPQATIDHVVPRSRGGTNDASNLITCCSDCNAKRGDRGVLAFARYLFGSQPPDLSQALVHSTVCAVRAARRRKLPAVPKAA